jgi:F0F1-type ATP synthase membrane subunit c/vacuolar-type H+-ATPase subunit K
MVPLSQGLLYAVAPAAVGAVAGAALLLPARARVAPGASPEALGRLMVFLVLPLSAVMLALVGALVSQPADASAVRAPLLALGAAAFVQAAAQGALGARAIPQVTDAPDRFGQALALVALPEVLTIGALLWVFLAAA